MKIVDTAIKRPIFIFMVFSSLIVLGVLGYNRLPVDLFPEIEFPTLIINVVYPGSNPSETENLIVKPVEDALSGISGIEKLTSTCVENVATISIEFDLDVDIQDAELQVRSKLSNVRADLPEDILEPTITRINFDSAPILWLGMSSDNRYGSTELRYLAEEKVKQLLQRINGVAEINISGGLQREIRVEVNRKLLESKGLTLDAVINAIRSSNIDIPAGSITKNTIDIPIRTIGKYKSIKQIEKVVVGYTKDNVEISIGNIANVIDSVKEQKTVSMLNGRKGVLLKVKKQSGSNTVDVAKAIKDEIPNVEKILPKGVVLKVVVDLSLFIERSILELLETLIIGGILAVVVVFIFLWHGRSTIVTAMALPNSIIGTFFFMYLFGFTQNLISMMALSLSIGLLIDDAIVVRENIFRYLEEGHSPREAARLGTKQVSLAVLSTSSCIIAVFLPIGFMGGITGQFFEQFGLVVVVAISISTLDAFTMAPMLSSTILSKYVSRSQRKKSVLYYGELIWNKFYGSIRNTYIVLLKWAMSHKIIIIVITICVFGTTLYAFNIVGKAFRNVEDRNEISISLEMQPGISLKKATKKTTRVIDVIKTEQNVKEIFATIGSELLGSNWANIALQLREKSEGRMVNAVEMMQDIRNRLNNAKIPGIRYNVGEINLLTEQKSYRQYPIALCIKGSDIDILNELGENVLTFLREAKGTTDVNSSLQIARPEIQVDVNYSDAEDLGVTTAVIGNSLRNGIEGYVPSKYSEGEDEYDIRIEYADIDEYDIDQIENISIPTLKGEAVTLKSISEIKLSGSPSQINREDRERLFFCMANLSPDAKLSEIVGSLNTRIKNEIDFPPGYTYFFEGEAKQQSESFTEIFTAFILAFIFIFMILASLYESFVHPFAIILSIPLSFVGAVFGLLLTDKNLDLMGMIGIIMLMGLVTKNAILLIDYTNNLRKKGKTREEALSIAGPIRLRPILMTTFAMIAGMFPIAIGWGESGSSRSGIAIVVIGGLITSTFLTLIIIPVVYLIIDQVKIAFMYLKDYPEDEYNKIANLYRRLGALLIDALFIILTANSIYYFSQDIQIVVITCVTVYLLNNIMLTWLAGKTLGKMLFRITVRDQNVKRVSLFRVALREVSKIVFMLLLFTGPLWAVWNKYHQALHDVIAKTLVFKLSEE